MPESMAQITQSTKYLKWLRLIATSSTVDEVP